VIAAACTLVAGAFAVATVAELTARWALRRQNAYYRYTPHQRTLHVFDPELWPGFPPTTWMEVNGDGERGGPAPRPDEHAFRAIVLGGSAAECVYLDQGGTWGAVVQRLLDAPEHRAALGGVTRVHVGNVSRAILPCEQLALLLRKILPRYQSLDLILIMAGAAELISWVERGAPPTIPDGAVSLDRVFEQHPEGPWGLRPRRTALWRVAANVRRPLLRPVFTMTDAGGWLRRVRAMRAAAPHRIDELPDATPMLAHFERHLGGLLAVAKAGAARVILVRQPWLAPPVTAAEDARMWNYGCGRPYRDQVDTYYTPRVVDALLRRVDERASAVATAAGVEQVDLMAVLPRGAPMFYDEHHFTPEGAEVVGRAVAAAILANPRGSG
jgi:lysophospholipase L1-like esterase